MKKLKLSAVFLFAAIALAGCTSSSGVLDPEDVAQGSHENISSLTAVIKANPRDPDGYNVRGSAYGRAGRNKEAIADFTSAIALD
ncbi:GlcNAc transferase, partial [Bartonella sp. M0193]|nr:GlcNAc transferase [Bartonella sp. M0193]